jgi:O-antigen ligase
MSPAASGTVTMPVPDQRRFDDNWFFLLFVVFIPLQNIYLQYIPSPVTGVNFVNAMFVASLLAAFHCRGGLVRGSGVNGWVLAYMILGVITLVLGRSFVAEPTGHIQFLKDQLIAVSFLFLAQMSVLDWTAWRRLFLASLVPLPYMIHVAWNQNASINAWHYTDHLRINGTFMELGANEMGAFFVTASLVAMGVAIGMHRPASWRLLCLGAALLATTGVVLSYSRTAYVAILSAAVLLVLLPRYRMRLVAPVLVVAFLLPVVLPQAVIERFDTISLEEGERDESTDSRFAFWELAGEQIAKRPMLGTGFHTFHHPEINPFEMDTHNFFLRELVEKGVVGALVLLILLWKVLGMLWRSFRIAEPGSLYYGFALGMLAALVALLIGNMFGDRFTHYPMIAHFWLYVGLALRGLQMRYADIAHGVEHERPA